MKRNLAIGVAALVALLGVYFVMKEEPQTRVRAPFTLAAVEGLSKAVVQLPAGEDGQAPPEIVVERGEAGWRITSPFDHALDETKAGTLDEVFAEDVRADDLKLSSDDAEAFGLGQGQATTVKLFTGGAEPAHTLEVGEMKLIERTGATRTFARVDGDARIRRLQANLKTLTDTDLQNWREKKVLSVNKAALDRIEVAPAGGEAFTLGVAGPPEPGGRNARWELREPKAAWPIEQAAAQGLANTVSNMSASGFVDDGDAAALGLDPPQVRLKLHSDEIVDVAASQVDGKFYVRVGTNPQIFEVTSFHGERLTRTLAGYRSLSLFGTTSDALTRIELIGPDRVVLEGQGDQWSVVAPAGAGELDANRLESTKTALANLKVMRWALGDEAAEAADSIDAASSPTFVLQAGEKTWRVVVGPPVSEQGERYARLGEGEGAIYARLSKYSARRMSAGLDALVVGEPGPGE